MPRQALTVCSTSGCPTLTESGACEQHRRQRKRNQARQRRAAGDPSMSIYSTDDWHKRRRAFLRRHPTCECGCGRPATEADHVPPRQLLVALGIHDPDSEQWLHAMAKPCHSRVTRLRDMPLLKRMNEGEPLELLAEEAMAWRLTR